MLHVARLVLCMALSFKGEDTPRFNVPFPTLGGTQLWADVFWHAGWRIQRNVLTGHHRLLDPRDVRRAWGSLDGCRSTFERRQRPRLAPLAGDRLVVLLHGLGRSRHSLRRMERALAAEGYLTASLSYPSTRGTIGEHADDLERLLRDLPGGLEVSFVTHSLGGLVVRELLSRPGALEPHLRGGRVVMLAPPNAGSRTARIADAAPLVRALLGPALHEIARLHARPAGRVPLEVGVVAAGRGRPRGWNPLLEGDDDGIVSVDETRLPGATDSTTLRGIHTTLMGDPEIIAATLRFLRSGSFGG